MEGKRIYKRARKMAIAQIKQCEQMRNVLPANSQNDNDGMKVARKWITAIDRARIDLEESKPETAEAISIYIFEPVEVGKEEAREKVLRKACISEPTFYRWREEFVQRVMMAAIELGVLNVYEKESRS